MNYVTCAHHNCNRPSRQPDVTRALCCARCQPAPHSMHSTTCNRAWTEEMFLGLEHTAARSYAEPMVSRAPVTRSLARAIALTLSLALSPLPLSCLLILYPSSTRLRPVCPHRLASMSMPTLVKGPAAGHGPALATIAGEPAQLRQPRSQRTRRTCLRATIAHCRLPSPSLSC